MIDIIRADQKKKIIKEKIEAMNQKWCMWILLNLSVYFLFIYSLIYFYFLNFAILLLYVILTVNIQKDNNKRDFDK